jgi:hypothetical protein
MQLVLPNWLRHESGASPDLEGGLHRTSVVRRRRSPQDEKTGSSRCLSPEMPSPREPEGLQGLGDEGVEGVSWVREAPKTVFGSSFGRRIDFQAWNRVFNGAFTLSEGGIVWPRV